MLTIRVTKQSQCYYFQHTAMCTYFATVAVYTGLLLLLLLLLLLVVAII